MDVNAAHALIDQFRETFEGTRPNWITDGKPETAVLGLLDSFTEAQANRPPATGARTVAQHTAHLWYSLDLFLKRVRGEDPKAEWETSFDLRGRDWATLKSDLRSAYEACLEVLAGNRDKPIDQWPPIHIAGLSAMTAHNAYHLGAIRQIGLVAAGR